ncbi:potassium-transporting ATPase subunit F [Streptomyces sp. CBMA156]|nr:potassium-transporting ATPase subunit F [Streptomyces sp. CBMA156]
MCRSSAGAARALGPWSRHLPNRSGGAHVRSHLRRCHGRRVRRHRPDRAGGGEAVSVENIAGLIVAVALVGYLVVALIFPEKF